MISAQSRWNTLRRPLMTIALCGAVAMSVQGCVGLLLGGAVVGGFAATDRRTLGAQTDDKTIAIKAESRIVGIVGEPSHINVTSFNRRVLITGEVRDDAAKVAAEQETKAIEGVHSVLNELVVAEPSSFGQRSNDTYITSKVKASLLDAKDVFGNAVKVVTERGVVYLMGQATEREAKRAAEIAAGVDGVQKVVKAFEYMTEEELTQLSSAPQK
ncbi:BON domain-containing protein [Glaciimonas sp. CA11.2]|uniref:BON domain-containing protein n=1 Tax=unclassified Glaciimonas TaxID=2644401 RepID=UPI002AB58FD6|nr:MULTISPECIES: BON domain-containing protein [unclassified Glaciimonas]MDY7546293.1 BON domain-containing protein [Glaciimonas sp. CA11.2]MEB0010758.1 BON domain-containing protein [Glaciimonas sp. Cout2]MEB0082106.1 BON domain-containing protein [Glaciimonas sp. Gout2]MEB0163060.1 BON domain-containing protein [Glaciimonas sp. CA11.2]